jgi:GTP-binding protein EngB required for normal cell division
MYPVPYEIEQANFKRHLRALLASDNGVPLSIVEQERRLAKRIRQSSISERLAHLLSGVQDAERKAAEPFEVFVMGEGKHGKSTFINSVLGQNAAATDFLPKTWCFNRYIALDNPADIVRVFADPRLLNDPNATRLRQTLGVQSGEFRGLLEFRVTREQADQIAFTEECQVSNSLGSPKPYFSPVMEMEWIVSSQNALLPGIRLVDTMGINQQLAPASHLHHLKWQYERADAVIWLVTAEKIGARELRKELLEARRYSKQLILVVNKWDQLSEASKQKALDRSEREYGQLVSAIVPMSALAAVIARQGLSATPTDDERQWAKKHESLSSEEVLTKSGLPMLQQHFEQFLDGRRALTRNLQIYAALRQKGSEFRTMASTARSDAEANLQLYEALRQRISSAKTKTTAQISGNTSNLSRDALRRVRSGIQSVDYDSRERARGLMQLDAITNDLRLLVQSESLAATAGYADILNWVASSAKQYLESEFSSTGRVAEKISTVCTTKTDVRVEAESTKWTIPDPTNSIQRFLIGVGDFLSEVPLLGGFVKNMVIEAKAKATREIREALEKDVIPQIEALFADMKKRLVKANDGVAVALETDCQEQFEQSGGKAMHTRMITDIDSALKGPTIEPLLIALPVRMMRRLNWRKA